MSKLGQILICNCDNEGGHYADCSYSKIDEVLEIIKEAERAARINALYEAADLVSWSSDAYQQVMTERQQLIEGNDLELDKPSATPGSSNPQVKATLQRVLDKLTSLEPDLYLVGCERHWSDDSSKDCTCDENTRLKKSGHREAIDQVRAILRKEIT